MTVALLVPIGNDSGRPRGTCEEARATLSAGPLSAAPAGGRRPRRRRRRPRRNPPRPAGRAARSGTPCPGPRLGRRTEAGTSQRITAARAVADGLERPRCGSARSTMQPSLVRQAEDLEVGIRLRAASSRRARQGDVLPLRPPSGCCCSMPSWITTRCPSRLRWRSSSTMSAPSSNARRNARSVFSGSSSDAPRWAMIQGRGAGGPTS